MIGFYFKKHWKVVLKMELENKVMNDLYRASGESISPKNVVSNSEPLNPSTMIYKLNSVRSLSELDESKLNSLLRALDEI